MRSTFLCIPLLALLALPLAHRERQVVCPILMYHHLVDLGASSDREMRTWSVSPRDFDAQMAWLQEHHYRCVTPGRIAGALRGGPPLPARPVCITFDDGWAEQYSAAWPIMHAHGVTTTFFIYTWSVGLGGWMSWAQLREMASAGCDVECHTFGHPALPGLSPEAMRKELVEPKRTIESHVGRTVDAIAYPFGKYNEAVIAATREAGYCCGVSTDPGIVQSESETYRLRRVMVSNGDPLPVFIAKVTGTSR